MEGGDAAGGEHGLPLAELFPPEFMAEHTDFESVERFWAQSPWEITSRADIARIPDNPLDGYVDQHTEFDGEEEMRWVAGTEWAAARFDD